MANKRVDTESVINLVINGKQADTTLRELRVSSARLNSTISNMKPSDPGYAKIERELQLVNKALAEQRRRLRGLDEETSLFKKHWQEIAAGVSVGNIISNGLSMAQSAITDFINGSQAAFAEAEKGQAQLAAVIDSTGSAAGKTKDQLNAMSEALMSKTGIDDDVITKSQQMLLTFTNVRNEIFDQSIPAIIDMTAAMNQGNVSMETIQATTIQVGKALNDPIKGMTALKKVGVTFSEDQKAVIKKLQETGDMAGAQAMILKELGKEFGGVADAVAKTDTGALQKFNTRLGNIQESAGGFITKLKGGFAIAFDPFLTWLERATETKLSDTLEQDRASLNANMLQLQASNTTHEQRVSIINTIKKQYPQYIGQIDAEKISNEKLLPILENINKALIVRIAFQKKAEGLNNAMEDEADMFLRADKAASGLSQTMALIMGRFKDGGFNIIMPKNLTDLQQADFLLDKLKKSKGLDFGFNTGLAAQDLTAAKNNLLGIRKNYDEAAAARAKLLGEQTRFASKYGLNQNGEDKKTADYNSKKAPPVAAPKQGIDKKEITAAQKLKEDLEKNAEEVYQNMLSKEDKELRVINAKYEKLYARAKGNKDQIIDLQNQEGNEVATLIRKQQAEEAELKKKKSDEAEKIAKEKGAKIVQQHLDDWALYYDTMVSDHQKEIDAVNEKYDKLFAIAEQYGMDMMELELMWAAEINAIDRPEKGGKKKLTKLEELEQYKKAALEVAQTVADTSFNIGAQKRQAETDQKLSALEKQRELELENAEGNEAAKAEINARYAEMEKAEKLRAWEANRKASINQALINGALAATNIWATTPKADFGLSTYIMLGLSAAATIASIATISSADPPEFAKGVRNFEGGVAMVGEAGRELINEDDKWWLTDGPTYADLAPGADVYNATETSQMLRDKMYPVSSYSLNTEGANRAEMSYRSNSTMPPAQAAAPGQRKGPQNNEMAEMRSMIKSLAQTVEAAANKQVVFDFHKFEEEQEYLKFTRNQQGG